MSEGTRNKRAGSELIEIIFDGGSRGNPGRAYGSYLMSHEGEKRRPVRLQLGTKTNNEAEYLTLIKALEDLQHDLDKQSTDPARIRLIIYGDSQLVIRQLQGQWKAKEQRMKALRDKALQLVAPFAEVEFRHQARWRSVDALGH